MLDGINKNKLWVLLTTVWCIGVISFYIGPVAKEIHKIPRKIEWSQNYQKNYFLERQRSNFIDCIDTSDTKFIEEFNKSQDILPMPKPGRGFVFRGWRWQKDSITRQEAMKSTKCADKFKEDVDLIKRNKRIEDKHYSIGYFLDDALYRNSKDALLFLIIFPFLLSLMLITKVRAGAKILLYLLLFPIKKAYSIVLNWLNK